MITISLLEEKDAPHLKEFSAREWPGADREHFGDLEGLDFNRPEFKLVAMEGDEIVGYIIFNLDMGVIFIDSLIVGATFRGRGIARGLVQAAEEKGRLLGAHRVWLETGMDWGAKELYLKLGYAVRAELKNYYAHRDFVLMDKDL